METTSSNRAKTRRSGTTDNLHGDVQPAAMRHCKHGFFGILLDGGGQNGIEERQKRGFAFKANITFQAKVARLQYLFEDLAA